MTNQRTLTKKESVQIQNIAKICWDQLIEHRNSATEPTDIGPPDLYLQGNNTLTYQPCEDDEIITEDQAEKKLQEWITRDILNNGYVVMYTCPDNSLISIDQISKKDPEFKLLEKQGRLPFYIAFD